MKYWRPNNNIWENIVKNEQYWTSSNNIDNGRQRDTTGDNGRQRETTEDNGRYTDFWKLHDV